MQVSAPTGDTFPFELDAFRRHCLMEGLDEIAMTLASAAAIGTYEARTGT
jgi:3-isopropylmalate/(R)-2-methylmalate dehydratase small subunit